MKFIFLVLAFSSVAWSQSIGGSGGLARERETTQQSSADEFDELLSCGTRLSGFEVFRKNDRDENWQGRIGSAGWADDGKYFGVRLSIRKEGDQCFVEINSRERSMKFEWWVGSNMNKIKALSGPGLNDADRTCSVNYVYGVSLSECTFPVKIIEERRRGSGNPDNCEITSYKTFPASEIDFISQGSDKVCVGVTHCAPRQPLHSELPARPPYDTWVACLPASTGECVQSYVNCGDDAHVRPKDEAARVRMRSTLGLPPRSRGQQ